MVIMRRHLSSRSLAALLLLTLACSSPAAEPQAAPAVPEVEAAGEVATPLRHSQVKPPTAPDDPTAQPVAATRPRALARQILAAERVIRNPRASENQLAVAGHTQQVAYRVLSERPRWHAKVKAALPKSMRESLRLNVAAHRELASLSGSKPPKTLPAWRIVEPAPRRELKRYYRKAQRVFGVPWQYLAAINLVETRMGRIRGVSTAGAQGPMQFIPPTWAIYGKGDVTDNHDAIMAAGRYLKARGAPGDMARALYSYNNSTKYVRAVAAHAEAMRQDPRAYRGYYHWQVYYRQRGGPVWLPVGYDGS